MLKRGEMEQGKGWLQLAFQAPVPAWRLEVILVESEAARPPAFLDDPGFPCLALISSSLARDQDTAGEMGARESSEEFFLEVGEKVLKILMLRGPDQELLELIEIPKTGARRTGGTTHN